MPVHQVPSVTRYFRLRRIVASAGTQEWKLTHCCKGLPQVRSSAARAAQQALCGGLLMPCLPRSDSADDRSGDMTYKKASTVPDFLPVAEAGSDWREFRYAAQQEQLHIVLAARLSSWSPKFWHCTPRFAASITSLTLQQLHMYDVVCRARLIASTRAATTTTTEESTGSNTAADAGWGTKSSFNQLEWAHELSKPETGCLLLAHPYMFRERQTYFYQVSNAPAGCRTVRRAVE